MAIAEVRDWLNAKGHFGRGVELLKRYGTPDKVTLFVLGCGPTLHSRRVLEEQLQRIDATMVEQAIAVIPEATKVAAPKPASAKEVELERRAQDRANGHDAKQNITEQELPPPLRPLRRQLSSLHTTRTFLKGQLLRVPDGAELRDLAMQIKEIRRKIKAGWIVIEAWRLTKVILQPAKELEPMSDHEAWKRIGSLNTYISRVKQGKRVVTAEKLAQWQLEKEELTKRVNGPVQG